MRIRRARPEEHAEIAAITLAAYAPFPLSSLATMSGAHRIYERLGFHRAPERDWSPAPGVHLIAYCLEL